MQIDLRRIKTDVSALGSKDLDRLYNWLVQLMEKREYEKAAKANRGISPKDVLKEFKRKSGGSRYCRNIQESSEGAHLMSDFYKSTRVRGCHLNYDEDMLAAFWGAVSSKEFRLAYVRQLMPSSRPGAEDEIRALTLDMRFPMTDKLKSLKSGHRWFRTPGQLEEFNHFVYASRVGSALAELKPSRTLLSYENVE